jgi:L-ascorbate metabolism protein UlaG (beta-lactamase superfamily)
MVVTWLGHSTVLVELDGRRLLTDPVFRSSVALLRRTAAATDVASLQGVDAVLVSHAHYDHLDFPSLRLLGNAVPVVAPAGVGRLLRSRGYDRVTELDRGEELQLGALTVRATHAEHKGRRSLFGGDTASIGYLLRGSRRIYFAGDTDLFDGMESLEANLDLALLPVAGWGPRTPRGHLDPRRAAEAARRLAPRIAVPIHWGTYRRLGMSRGDAVLRAPADAFVKSVAELAPGVEIRVLPVGGSLELASDGAMLPPGVDR